MKKKQDWLILGVIAIVAALLLAGTCFLSSDKTTEFAPHLTAAEAGELAKKAGVGRLLCTHIWGGGYTDEQILKEARKEFPAAEVVEEMGCLGSGLGAGSSVVPNCASRLEAISSATAAVAASFSASGSLS